MTDVATAGTNGTTTPADVTTGKIFPTTFSGKPFADAEHIVNVDGKYLFCRYWKPDQDVTALLFFCHGYAEHCGRYEEVAEVLKEMGLYSFSHDHLGHGESEGERVHFSDYKVLIRDMWQHIEMMKAKYPGVPVFLYGHSMGGGLSVLTAQEKPEFFSGVILSAPLIYANADTATPVKVFMVKVLSYLTPKVRIAKLNVEWLSRDKNQIENYVKDPLVDCGGIRIGVARQLLGMCEDLAKAMPEIEWPFLASHGEDDKICDIGGTKLIYELAKSKDKTLKTYPDTMHMIEHEMPDLINTYLNDVATWLKGRMTAASRVREE